MVNTSSQASARWKESMSAVNFSAAVRTAAFSSASVPSEEAALAFDAYLMAITALGNAEDMSSRESIAAALSAINELEGSTGIISISMNGSPVKSVQIYRTEEESDEAILAAFLQQYLLPAGISCRRCNVI